MDTTQPLQQSVSQKQRRKKFVQITVLILCIIALSLGAFASMFLIQQRQDVRQQASVETGVVTVTTKPPTTVSDGTSKVDFYLNSNSMQIDGVQLAFNVNSTVLSSVDFTIDPASGLQAVAKKVTPNATGYTIKLIAIGPVGQPYSTTTDTRIGELSFFPTGTGNVQLVFDHNQSMSTQYKSNPVKDQLKPIIDVSFSVQAGIGGQPTPTPPTPTPTTTPTITSQPTPTPSGSTTPTTTPSSTPTATPTPTPTSTPISSSTNTPTPTATSTSTPGLPSAGQGDSTFLIVVGIAVVAVSGVLALLYFL